MRRTVLGAAAVVGLCVLGARVARAEGFLSLDDGRFVLDHRMVRTREGVVVKFGHGEAFVSKARLAWSTVDAFEGVDPDVWTAEEKERIAQGFVRHLGQWQSREKLRQELAKRHTARTREAETRGEKDVEERLRWSNRQKDVKLGHFVFDTTLDEVRLKTYADYMELFLNLVQEDLGLPTKAKESLRVGIFHDLATYLQVLGLREVGSGLSIDFRDREGPEQFFYDAPLSMEQTNRNMRFALTRYALYLAEPKFEHPSWVSSALAEYYGGMRWKPGKPGPYATLQLDLMSAVHEDLLHDRAQSIHDLIASGLKLGEAQHPWAWALIQFLMTQPQYAKRFRAFVKDLPRTKTLLREAEDPHPDEPEVLREADPEDVARLFAARLGRSPEKLQTEWYQYIRDYKASKSPDDLATAAADALRRGDAPTAEAYARRALEVEAPTAERLSVHARALLALKRHGEAFEEFRRAAALDALAADTYYWLARCMFELGPKRDPEQEKEWLLLAREIEPWNENILYAVDQMFEMRRNARR